MNSKEKYYAHMEKYWRMWLRSARGIAVSSLEMIMQVMKDLERGGRGVDDPDWRVMAYNASGYLDAVGEIDRVLKLDGEGFCEKAEDLVNRCGWNWRWYRWDGVREVPDV